MLLSQFLILADTYKSNVYFRYYLTMSDYQNNRPAGALHHIIGNQPLVATTKLWVQPVQLISTLAGGRYLPIGDSYTISVWASTQIADGLVHFDDCIMEIWRE